jgi:hypothetical protein
MTRRASRETTIEIPPCQSCWRHPLFFWRSHLWQTPPLGTVQAVSEWIMGTENACDFGTAHPQQIHRVLRASCSKIAQTTRSLSFHRFPGGLGFQTHFERKLLIPSLRPRTTSNNKAFDRQHHSSCIIHSSFVIVINNVHLFVAHDGRAAFVTAVPLLLCFALLML